eukprot:5560678-Karenia_brevis.AAC.1
MGEPIDDEIVARAIQILKTTTAVDLWSPADLRRLPSKALRGLADILHVVEANATWPSHLLSNIIVLMGKPQGGTRPIAPMPMLYRIWTKVRVRKPYIQKWERANAGPWDAAIEGSSALRAALTSMFGNELAFYKWDATLSTLCDMENSMTTFPFQH